MQWVTDIAVCEDDAADMAILTGLLEESLKGLTVKPAIHTFASGEALLASFRPGVYDIIFLDMYLSGMDGMQTARALRQEDRDCHIVFISQSKAYALEGYRVSALHYLVKPVNQQDIEEVWLRCKKPVDPSGKCITLLIDRRPQDIPLSAIMYVEADNKRCRVHTTSEVYFTRIPIDQLAFMLEGLPFCRCHRSYIVNFDHVKRIEADFFMTNGDTVYIRRNECTLIRERYFEYLIGKVGTHQQSTPLDNRHAF